MRPTKYRNPSKFLPIPPPPAFWFMPPVRIDAALAAQLTQRSARTVDRWRATGIDDPACLALLQAHAFGLLQHPDWREWRIAPDGTLGHWSGKRCLSGLRPVHLANLIAAHADARILRRENAALRATIEALRQPQSWPPVMAANDSERAPQLPLFGQA